MTLTTGSTSLFPKVDAWVSLVKAHERLIIIGIGAFVALHFYSQAIGAWEKHDERISTQAAAQVKVDDTQTKNLSTQLVALKSQVSATSVTISKQIAQRDQATKTQQKIDETLPLTGIQSRLVDIAALQDQDVQPSGDGQALVLSDKAAHVIAAKMEALPTLEADNLAFQTELANDQKIIDKQDQVIAALNTNLADEKKSHVADVNLEKAKTKKAFVRGLKIGVPIGVIIGLFLGHG